MSAAVPIALGDIERCFGGAIPAVLATASADGVVNITYISRAHQVDETRVAVSNQFMSKTSRNLAGNPRASLLLMDPATHDEYRLALVYERTERRGPVFERLRSDIDALAVLENMQDVFRLRAADVFRVELIEELPRNPDGVIPPPGAGGRAPSTALDGLVELTRRIARAGDLDTVVETALGGLAGLLGYEHTALLLLDESGTGLYTIGSHGFDSENIGSEVRVGEGQIGLAAQRCEVMRIGNLHQMAKYARAIRHGYEGDIGPGRELAVPAMSGVESRVVVPMMARGELVGVLVTESPHASAFGAADEHVLTVVCALLGSAIEHVRTDEREPDDPMSPVAPPTDPAQTDPASVNTAPPGSPAAAAPVVRFFAVDGSVFVDGDYLIKGVAGRILWSLLGHHAADGRVDFTNRELRLDPSLELPGYKDNLESRLILLKRRLVERDAPFQLDKTGRGRFRLVVIAEPELDAAAT